MMVMGGCISLMVKQDVSAVFIMVRIHYASCIFSKNAIFYSFLGSFYLKFRITGRIEHKYM